MRNLFLLLLVGLSIGCNQQLVEENRDSAKEQIVNLKEKGALIVRLKAQTKKMEKLRERGLDAAADRVKTEAIAQNKELMAAFKADFDFCPVYFIDERGTAAVRKGEAKAGIFLDENLAIDKSIKCNADYILTAEYGQTYRNSEGPADNSDTLEEYQGSPSQLELTGIVVKDDQFVPLQRPFPYYVKAHTAIILTRNESEMVKILNRNFNAFYKQQK